jgi:hypothetical protein
MSYKVAIMETAQVSDMSFADYDKRQLFEISVDRNKQRALGAKPAGNFCYHDNSWHPQEYEGFAIVSMLSDNEGNEPLTARLVQIQQELQYNLPPQSAFYYLPSQSFHQTVANTLSADRFKNNILYAGLEEAYPGMVKNAFNHIPVAEGLEPIKMKMVGLSIFGTAIGILGIFENEDHYNRIANFRTGFYADEQLAGLYVKMTRPFIGHITLAYIENSLNINQKKHMPGVISEINQALSQEENYFNISNTGLRRYHHLAEFIKQDNYPVYQL